MGPQTVPRTVQTSGALFQPLVGILLDMRWSGHLINGLKIYTPCDYQFALSVLPLILLVSALCGVYLRESYGNSC